MENKMLFRWKIYKSILGKVYYVKIKKKRTIWWSTFHDATLMSACVIVEGRGYYDHSDFRYALNITQLIDECGGIDNFMRKYIKKVLDEKESKEVKAEEKIKSIASEGWHNIEIENQK